MKPLILRSLAGVLVFGLIFAAVNWKQDSGSRARSQVPQPSASQAAVAAPEAARASPRLQVSAGPAAQPAAALALTVKPEGPHQMLETYAFREDIENFRALNKKVFLTDDEKRAKRELLENDEFVKSLTHLLKVGAGDSTEMKQAQDAALDVLFESLRTDANSPVAEVLMEIVGDTQIESESIDMVTKRDLAGVKAEVLYYWSSLDPASSGRIEQSLPGPVSRRIWENVVSVQKNNLEESSIEAARYPSSVDEL
ncbi:MAG: hypothetical protein KF681_16610 [Bdellovibrionaceae bacterium]|nr:hypothetical protein [Pseudobdellovibrionaceae bacterium]